MLFFDPDYTDEPPERGQDALKAMELSEETKQKAEESLKNLLELGGDEDDELLLDIDTQLTEKQLQKMPMISGKANLISILFHTINLYLTVMSRSLIFADFLQVKRTKTSLHQK